MPAAEAAELGGSSKCSPGRSFGNGDRVFSVVRKGLPFCLTVSDWVYIHTSNVPRLLVPIHQISNSPLTHPAAPTDESCTQEVPSILIIFFTTMILITIIMMLKMLIIIIIMIVPKHENNSNNRST